MELCRNCLMFNVAFNKMNELLEDTNIKEDKYNYCIMQENTIPEKVYIGLEKCPYYVSK